MKTRTLWLLPIVTLLLFLTSCVSTPPPETMNQRLAMMQVSYGVLLDKAILYKKEGRISADQSKRLSQNFNDIEQGLTLARQALSLGNELNFNDQSSLVLNSMALLRELLTNAEGRPT